MSSCLPPQSDTNAALLKCIAGTRRTEVCLRVPSQDAAIPAIKVTVTTADCVTTISYLDPATELALVADADYAVLASGAADEVICPPLAFNSTTTVTGNGGAVDPCCPATNALLANINTSMTTTAIETLTTYVDTVENLLATSQTLLTTLGSNTDQVEALLNTLGVQTDQVEPLLTSIRDNIQTLQGIESTISTGVATGNASLSNIQAFLTREAGLDCDNAISPQQGIPVILKAVGTIKLCAATLLELTDALNNHAVVEVEAGCALGVPYTRVTGKIVDSNGNNLSTNTFYRDSLGNATPSQPTAFTLGACSPVVFTEQVDSWTTADGSGIIAGAALIAADPNFTGALSSFTTIDINDMQSITITAKNVTDGVGSTDFVEITLPVFGVIRMFDGQTITFSVVKEKDSSLANPYTITAAGLAYANIFGTKRYVV
jgi:hypothetical protein